MLDLGLKKASASLFGYAEEVRPIEIAELKPFPGHPFEVKMDDKMTRLVEKNKKERWCVRTCHCMARR